MNIVTMATVLRGMVVRLPVNLKDVVTVYLITMVLMMSSEVVTMRNVMMEIIVLVMDVELYVEQKIDVEICM